MRESRLSEEAGQQYATAYDTHYTTKDIHKAFTLYEDIFNRSEDGDQPCRPCEVKSPQEFRHERNDRNYCTSIS